MRSSDWSSDVCSSDLPASFTRGGLFFCSKDNPLDGKPIKSSGGKNAAQAPAGYHWSQCSRRAVEHVPYPPLDPCEWRRVLPHSQQCHDGDRRHDGNRSKTSCRDSIDRKSTRLNSSH